MRNEIEIKIPKDILKYKENIAMGLNLRQIICSCLAVVMAVGIYFLAKNILGKETASWLCILGACPFAVAGFFTYNGLYAEQFVAEFFKTSYVKNGMRFFVGENKIYKKWEAYKNVENAKKHKDKRKRGNKKKGKNSTAEHTD
jgi:hypothetical protein